MKWGYILGVTALLLLIFLYEWPKLKGNGQKVQIAFFTLVAFDWFLAVLLVLFPEMPGPGHLIDFIYKSIGEFWKL